MVRGVVGGVIGGVVRIAGYRWASDIRGLLRYTVRIGGGEGCIRWRLHQERPSHFLILQQAHCMYTSLEKGVAEGVWLTFPYPYQLS